MKLKRIFAIVLRYIFLLRHNKTRLITILGWPIVDILIWGFTTVYLDSVNKLNFSFMTVMLGAAILWLITSEIHRGFMLPFLEDMWSRNFLNLFASPLKIKEYIIGLTLNAFITISFSFIIILFIVYLFFGYDIFQLGFILAPFFIILFIFGLGLGIITISFILRFGPPAEWLGWIIPFLIAPLSSIYYPVSALPEIIQPIAKIIPTTYVFEGMRDIILYDVIPIKNLIIGFILSLVYLLIIYWFFVYTFKLVLKNGLLARFSAETEM